MKLIPVIIGTVLASFLVGCSTTPVAVALVGPNPDGVKTQAQNGQLEVYSALTGRTEGDNPTWYQHTDYTICNQLGEVINDVDNTVGYYASKPRIISLPPGKYFVKAEAKDYATVKIPVVIKSGRITRVHLDDAWRPMDTTQTALVRLPAGDPVGWSASSR